MNGEENKTVTVHIKYGSLEKTFVGRLEEVWLNIDKFFNEFIPSFELSKKLLLNVDLKELVEACEGVIAFSIEGANLLIPRDKLTDNETLLLRLLAQHVGFKLSLVANETVSKEELMAKLGKNAKITSTRLGELVRTQVITKTVEDRYRITAFGITQMQREILPRIKARISS